MKVNDSLVLKGGGRRRVGGSWIHLPVHAVVGTKDGLLKTSTKDHLGGLKRGYLMIQYIYNIQCMYFTRRSLHLIDVFPPSSRSP